MTVHIGYVDDYDDPEDPEVSVDYFDNIPNTDGLFKFIDTEDRSLEIHSRDGIINNGYWEIIQVCNSYFIINSRSRREWCNTTYMSIKQWYTIRKILNMLSPPY